MAKKVWAVCLTVILVWGIGMTAMAANGGFVSSPSGVSAPTLESYQNADENCTARLTIVAYGNRDTLDETTRTALEKAYERIINAKDLTELNEALKEWAAQKGLSADELAVSDLFDISYSDCEGHEGHGAFTITLKPEVLKNFVGLLHFKDGRFEWVKDVKVSEDGTRLTFTVEDLSPFAIVVNTGDGKTPPQTGHDGMEVLLISLMVVAVIGLIVVAILSKKKKAE